MPLTEKELRACCREAVSVCAQRCAAGEIAVPWGLSWKRHLFTLHEFRQALRHELGTLKMPPSTACESLLAVLRFAEDHGGGWYGYLVARGGKKRGDRLRWRQRQGRGTR